MTPTNATNSSLRDLTIQFAQAGKLEEIYLRPARGIACVQTNTTIALAGQGLQGDRTAMAASRNTLGSNRQASNRQVTLIQAEHIAVIAAFLGKPIDAALLRRNLVISGINLLAAKSLFKDQPMHLKIGEVVLEITGPCEPCSKMEATLGKGAYNAMRGHGGVNARVITGGELTLGNVVQCSVAQTNIVTQQYLF